MPQEVIMPSENKVKTWLQQIRAPFLILSVVLVMISAAAARSDTGSVNLTHTLLLTLGVVITHISVNLFNELSDQQTGIDNHTRRTPFSGGSGMMQTGATTPRQVRLAAYLTLLAAAAIGIYFALISGWVILVFMAVGGLAIRFYTTHLARWLLGEIVAGLALGTMVVLGAYYALTSGLNSAIVIISLPPGLLTALLLFLNEFPDADADRQGGRHHLVIHFGHKISARIYVSVISLVYLLILAAPLVTRAPWTVLLGLLTFPAALKASTTTLRHYQNIPKLVPAMGMNVLVVLLTDLLIAVGYFIS
jgi:1,4-dihydroxy-2-naphthoate octaprenyltransferase